MVFAAGETFTEPVPAGVTLPMPWLMLVLVLLSGSVMLQKSGVDSPS